MENANFWINNSGQNMLGGVDGDPSNPPMLPDEYIVRFLRMIPAARPSFDVLFPQMSALEQQRLNGLLHSAQSYIQTDPVNDTDAFVRKASPRIQRGGGWMPPPLGQ